MRTFLKIVDVVLDVAIVIFALIDAWQGNYGYAIFLILLLIFLNSWSKRG